MMIKPTRKTMALLYCESSVARDTSKKSFITYFVLISLEGHIELQDYSCQWVDLGGSSVYTWRCTNGCGEFIFLTHLPWLISNWYFKRIWANQIFGVLNKISLKREIVDCY